jgi:integrase
LRQIKTGLLPRPNFLMPRWAPVLQEKPGVHTRGREFYYYQAGRGTPHAGPRTRLPNDPHSPEFWNAIRRAQGIVGPVAADTVNGLIDAFITTFPQPLKRKLSPATQYQYRRSLALARKAWGDLPTEGLRPMHVQTLMDTMNDTPGKANGFLGAMRALSKFARKRDLVSSSLVEGVSPYDVSDRGHKPWTAAQVKAAHDKLTGHIRRGVLLALYTGQRGSDVVRLGWTDVDPGPAGDGLKLKQKKTGVEPWCPILPELANEMATWDKRPGPCTFGSTSTRHGRTSRNLPARRCTACAPMPSSACASTA